MTLKFVGFTEKQFRDLDDFLGELKGSIDQIHEDIGEYVTEYLEETGVGINMSVTDENLDITLS